MKGIIIHGNPMWGDNERATYCEFINEAAFELKQNDSRMIISSLEGEASKSSKAVCSKDDAYDFEKDFIRRARWTGPTTFSWELKKPAKREQMWDDILKEGRTPVYVERKDIHDFLEECQIAGIKWTSGKLPLEVAPFNLSEGCDGVYFFVMTSLDISKSNKNTKEFRHVMSWWTTACDEERKIAINYLPPMRWDLFKKGRLVVRVTPDNFDEAMARIRANVALIYGGYGWERVIKNNFNKQHGFIRVHAIAKDTGYASLEFMEPEDLVKKQLANPTVYSSKKIVDWEDIR